jgi:type IV secretion system protein VirB11
MSATISPHLSLAAEQQTRVREKITRELGPLITALLHERDVIEIMLNDDGRLWVERLGEQMQPVGVMAAWQAEALIGTVASTMHGNVTRESPILECELSIDGSRFEALIPPIVPAPVFTLRRKALKIFTLDDYVASNIMTATQRDILRQVIRQHDNILVVGGTSTGKTTLTNALIDEIAAQFPLQRMVIIEDTGELQCRSENRVMLHATTHVDMLRLLKTTMRLRPDRILVGEVRGAEALSLLKAWNTGHPGGIATVHANDAAAGLVRMEQLIAETTPAPMQQTIAMAINVIVAIAKTPAGRRIQSMVRVLGHDGTHYRTTPLSGA